MEKIKYLELLSFLVNIISKDDNVIVSNITDPENPAKPFKIKIMLNDKLWFEKSGPGETVVASVIEELFGMAREYDQIKKSLVKASGELFGYQDSFNISRANSAIAYALSGDNKDLIEFSHEQGAYEAYKYSLEVIGSL